MKLTKQQLKQIIKEEIENIIAERGAGPTPLSPEEQWLRAGSIPDDGPKPFTPGAADERAAAQSRLINRERRARGWADGSWQPEDGVPDPLDPHGIDPAGSGGKALYVDYTIKGPDGRTNIERANVRRRLRARDKRRKAAAAEKLKKNENMAPLEELGVGGEVERAAMGPPGRDQGRMLGKIPKGDAQNMPSRPPIKLKTIAGNPAKIAIANLLHNAIKRFSKGSKKKK